jgi:hypothetical protein
MSFMFKCIILITNELILFTKEREDKPPTQDLSIPQDHVARSKSDTASTKVATDRHSLML